MSIGDKVNEALCWLKEELNEIVNEFDYEKNEKKFEGLCNKLNDKIRSLSDLNVLPDINKNSIDLHQLIQWSNLNFCIFHYSHLYKKVHEKLFIEEEDFSINFDEDNYYVKKMFPFTLAFHPLTYKIDISYYHFLLSLIYNPEDKEPLEKFNVYESISSKSFFVNSLENIKEEGGEYYNCNNDSSKLKKKKKSQVEYVLSNDMDFKKKFVMNHETYSKLKEIFPIDHTAYACLEEENLHNFKQNTLGRKQEFQKGKEREDENEDEEDSEEKEEEGFNEKKEEPTKYPENQFIRKKSKKELYNEINKSHKYTLTHKMYMINEDINKKIRIFNGDITKVNTQGIVLFANSNYKFSKDVCKNLFSFNLMKLEEEEKYEIKNKKSGEVYVTYSYDNVHKYILHVMLPKYNSKFILATNNTMNLCVQEILYACYENKIQSVSIPFVFFNLFFPINIFIITFLKSLRSFILLPQFGNTLKHIVLVTNSNEVYLLLLKYVSVFFPRNEQEQLLSTNIAMLGNKFGSIDVESRSIRIFKSLRNIKYHKMKKKRKKKKKTKMELQIEGEINKDQTKQNHKLINNKKLDSSSISSSNSLSNISSNVLSNHSTDDLSSHNIESSISNSSGSEIFKEADEEFLNLKSENESYKNFFNLNQVSKNDEMNLEYCLRLSHIYDKREKFSEFKKMSFIYEYGFDELGRNIIVVNFSHFPLLCNFNLLFFYLIFYFNNFMKNHFVLLFIFSENISSRLTSVLSLFKDLFQMIQEFLKNLKVIYFFNYSIIFKFFIYVLYPFIPSTIYENIIYLNDTMELSKHFDVKRVLKKS